MYFDVFFWSFLTSARIDDSRVLSSPRRVAMAANCDSMSLYVVGTTGVATLVSVVAAGAAGAAGAAVLVAGAAVLALATVAVLAEVFLGVDGGVDLAEEDFCFLMEGGMVMIIYDVLTLNDFIYQIYSYRD